MSLGRRSNLAAAGGIVAIVVLANATIALAQGPRSVRVDYEAPLECPDQHAFEGQLRGRSAKIVIAADGPASLRVRITPHGGRFEGDLVVADAKGHDARRHVEGACSDVTAALALVAALALDPTASASEPTSVASPAPTTPAPSSSASSLPPSLPAPSAAPAPPMTPEAPSKPHGPRPGADAEALGDNEARSHRWGWSIGAHAGITEGIVPGALVSVPAFVEVWRRALGVVALAPTFRLRFEHADSGTITAGTNGAGAAGGNATTDGGNLTWNAGSLDVCPIAITAPASQRFRISPCLRVEGGALAASGTGVSAPRSDLRPWLAFGLLARARVTLVGSLFVELEGGAFVPAIRDRFFVEPDSTVAQPAVVAAAGAAGLGVTFW